MKFDRQKWLTLLLPSLFLVLGFSFVYYIQSCFNQTAKELVNVKSSFIEKQIANNIEQLILNRARILSVAAETQAKNFPKNYKAYQEIASSIYKNIPEFLAVNWIAPDGIIRWVYPDDHINSMAKNKNVIERPELTNFLKDSRTTHKTQLTQIVSLYQGIKGFVLYTPIYTEDGNFQGWFNGVIKYKELLDSFFSIEKFKDFHLKVTWENDKNSIYEYGPAHKLIPELASKFKILNQTLLVEANLRSDALTLKNQNILSVIFIFSYLVIFIFSLLLYRFLRTHLDLANTSDKLHRDQTIISVLSHDMATPLTLIAESADRLKEKIQTPYIELDRIISAAKKQNDLLRKVRSLHANRMGRLKMELTPCQMKNLVMEALQEADTQLKSKNISCKIEIPDGLPLFLTDYTSALNNVLGNVFSNAIKFSDPNTTVILSANTENNFVILKVQDQGCGIPKEVLKNISNKRTNPTKIGTRGESGTGLGILQIQTFMEAYGGKVQFSSDDSGTTVELYFLKAHQNLSGQR